MNKKVSVGVLVTFVAIACAITYVITITVSTNMFNERLGGVTERGEIYSKLQEIDTYVRSSSYYDIDDRTLMDSIVNGYVDGLRDAGADYLSANEVYKKSQIESGVMISSGIEAAKEESGYIVVTQVYADSPAEEAGIRAGDIITAVDGANVLEIGADAAIIALDGDENTNVRLSVQRGGETVSFTVTRRSFTIKTVSYSLAGVCGYVRISAFNALTADSFTSAVQTLSAQGATGYILDVRGSGGTYDGLREMLGMFISAQVLANARYKDGTAAKFLETTGEASVTAPVVVLVNESTEGAGELFALSLRDFADAKIVGKQTAGKGALTETKNLSDGTAIVITCAELVPVLSETLDGGVKADFSVDIAGEPDYAPTETSSADPQLNKAFEVLGGLKSS